MKPHVALPLAAAVLMTVIACSRDNTTHAIETGTASAEAQPPAPGANAATPNVVTITATNYKFDAPASIPAGLTTIRLVDNAGLHQATLLRLTDGKTVADLGKALQKPGPMPSWVIPSGGPNPPHPNGGVAEVTQTLVPGNYAIICFVPDPDGTPHFVKGMISPLTVTPMSAASAAEPVADVVVTMSDYSYKFSTPLTAGKHVIRVDNTGPQLHELFLARLAPGKTAGELAAWVDKQAGPPPAEPMGGLSMLPPGGHAYIPVDLTPGQYGIFCFEPDAKDGKPHVAHGMMEQITVK
jgi:hypothetical protein